MTIVEDHSAEELQGLFRQEKDARMAKRMWVAWQARLGITEPQSTAAIGRARRTVQIGVPRYNEEGLAGLRDRVGRGREPNRSCPSPSNSVWPNGWKRGRGRAMSVRCEASTCRSSLKISWAS